MNAHDLFRERWPELASQLDSLPESEGLGADDGSGKPRLLVHGRSLVSPRHPEKEAARILHSLLPEASDKRVCLAGHGFGHMIAAILSQGVRELQVLLPVPELMRAALDHWACPEVLHDSRLSFVTGGAGPLVDDVTYIEHPAWRKQFPERFARLRVSLGRCASSAYRLKILVVEPLYGGSLPAARACARALEANGHEVRSMSFENMAGARESFQDFAELRPGGDVLAREFTGLMGRMLAVECRSYKPDLVLALAQSPATPPVMQELRSAGIRTAFWFVEDYLHLPYWRGLHGSFDLFLTIQKGAFHEELRQISPAPVRYLPVCADTDFMQPTGWDREGQTPQISFVGAGYHNRERAFLRLMDLPLKVWGSDWRPQSPVCSKLQDEGQRTNPNLNRMIFSNSQINLNLHSSTYHEGVNPYGDFVNPRTFEIAACGGFQLVDQRSLLAELMQPGKDLISFSSVEEMRSLVEEWLKKPEEAAAIAANGRARVLREHGYSHRMQELLELFFIEEESAFPHARRRIGEETLHEDPELRAWLQEHGYELDADLDDVLGRIRSSGEELDETASLLLYMGELRDWAREKGIDRAYEQIRG